MSKQIMVGGVAIGGGAPVSIQSMCNTATENVEATVQQILRLEQAGCEIIRVAVPTEEAARAITFLAGDEASFITGQVLAPNGGMVI